MSLRKKALVAVALALAQPLAAQTTGAIAGHVRERSSNAPLEGAEISLDGQWLGRTDTAGAYRIREVRSGWHRLVARRIGHQTVQRDSVLVLAGQTTVVNFALPLPVELAPVVVESYADSILDPLVVADVQRITAQDLRRYPVTTLEEALALSAGAVGESYRGGRVGQQAFILDGLGLKNQLDASTGPLGVRIPPDILTEASLITNGFSARYGQAVSGLVNVVTKDGGERWTGRTAYETDRPLWGSWDLGLDRAVASVDGPLGKGALVAVVDAEGRLDADPVNAPLPSDPRDPRSAGPAMLPHNSGERYDAALKLRLPLGTSQTLRLFGLRSAEQRLLYDPAYKYDEDLAPARRVTGDLLSGHLQRRSRSVTADLRGAYFAREFLRGAPTAMPDYRFGAFTGRTLHFIGEDVARSQDTAAARALIAGFEVPDWSTRSPWGVPAFFVGGGPRGEIVWNRLRELRGQVDVSIGLPAGGGRGAGGDLFVGASASRQQVQTFQRALAYLPAGSGVPPASASTFTPTTAALYAETQLRGSDFALTLGLRYDRFDPRTDLPGSSGGAPAHQAFSPRFAFSTVLKGATFVASWGRFRQAPDFQYLVDAAFDDTARTGRFRRGNPNLGFESATQWEFSLRTRPSPITSVRVNVFTKELDGLVASVPLGVDPDSTIFGNLDFGSVKGAEVLFEREIENGWGMRVTYTLLQAQATATNAFQLLRRIRLDPLGDTIKPARVEFPLDYDQRHSLTAVAQARVPARVGPRIGSARLLAGLEAVAIGRYQSGLPYSRTNVTGDTLIGLPNSYRLPPQWTLDLLVRRPLVIGRRGGGLRGSVYIDVRNALNRRNVEAVRRDVGAPGPTPDAVLQMAEDAYAAHPEAIPYESPRYRPVADLNRDGLIAGRAELFPLYLAAARDFTQPLFAYGPPRLVRVGVELEF